MARLLELKSAADLKDWMGQLREWRLVRVQGRTKAMEYSVDPEVLRRLKFKGTTSLKGIQKHRLSELVMRDLEIYGRASISQIHQRIGPEIPRRRVQRMLAELGSKGRIGAEGWGRGRSYVFVPKSS